MEGTFDFTELGFGGSFINPIISEIPPTQINIQDVEGLLLVASVRLTGEDYDITLRLPDIIVQDFNFDAGQLAVRVTKRLEDFKI